MNATKDQIHKAILECIRRANDRPSDEWYAVTVHPDGRIEHRCGIGAMTYSADEYYGITAEQTVYTCKGFTLGTWVEWQGDETDDERADVLEFEMDEFVEREIEGYQESAEEATRTTMMQAEWKAECATRDTQS